MAGWSTSWCANALNSDDQYIMINSRPVGQVADPATWLALEIPTLLQKIASLATSRAGADMVMGLVPCQDLPTIERRQDRLSQLRGLLEQGQAPAINALDEVEPLLDRLAVSGAFLLPPELLLMADFLDSLQGVVGFLNNSGPDGPAPDAPYNELARLANQMAPLPGVSKDLRKLVGPGNSVSSQASVELARIRRELARKRDALRLALGGLLQKDEFSGIFSDQIITQRADRFVLPVKSDAKGRMAGIIHDTSGTGATCFVEPLEAIEGNNQLALLLRQEKEEEERILRAASATLAKDLEALKQNHACLIKLDCLLAQAHFCNKLECHQPRLSAGGEISLYRARHPLLAWLGITQPGKKVVPVEISMAADKKVLVISGANAGGKTATLKTMGLLTVMAMCGMHVPCAENSRLVVFKRILAEIGDEQSLDLALSTFTAHASRLAAMVKQADDNALFLIDEIGGGTDPNEGAALALAVLKWLQDAGGRVMCTTHYHRLKAYASTTPGVENVSVSFEEASGQPTYQLHYGLAGFSGALTVSKTLGFPEELLELAREQLDRSESQTIALLHEAHQAREKAGQEYMKASAELLRAKEASQEAGLLLKSAKERQAGALAEGKRKVREMIRRFEQRLEKTLGKIEQANKEEQKISLGRARQELYEARRVCQEEMESALAPRPERPKPAPIGFSITEGQAVRLLNLQQHGVVMETPRPGQNLVPVAVGVKGVRIMAELNQLAPADKSAVNNGSPSTPVAVRVEAGAGSGLALELVGMRVDDALDKLDKALDEAVLAGRSGLEIIHGVGSGRLKAAVREYLGSHPFVAGYSSPANRPGSAGITQVTFKD